MNIYFINPRFFEPSKFHHLLRVLKVKMVISLIPDNTDFDPRDYANTDYYRESCNSYLYDEEWVESFRYKNLPYCLSNPIFKSYLEISKEICEEIVSQEELDGYWESVSMFDNVKMPYSYSKSKDFVGNIIDYDDPNIMVFYSQGFDVSKLAEHIYKRLFDMFDSPEYEEYIPILLISSVWTTDMESSLVGIYRKRTKEEKKDLCVIDSKTKEIRLATPIERNRKGFMELLMNDLSSYDRFKRSGIQNDPLCYLFNPSLSIWDVDEYEQKMQLARLLFKEQVVSFMDMRDGEEQYENGCDNYDEEGNPPVYEVEDDDW